MPAGMAGAVIKGYLRDGPMAAGRVTAVNSIIYLVGLVVVVLFVLSLLGLR